MGDGAGDRTGRCTECGTRRRYWNRPGRRSRPSSARFTPLIVDWAERFYEEGWTGRDGNVPWFVLKEQAAPWSEFQRALRRAQVARPKSALPPVQTVVYFPHSSAQFYHTWQENQLWGLDFLIKSGRAVMFPIYQQTYERVRPPARG